MFYLISTGGEHCLTLIPSEWLLVFTEFTCSVISLAHFLLRLEHTSLYCFTPDLGHRFNRLNHPKEYMKLLNVYPTRSTTNYMSVYGMDLWNWSSDELKQSTNINHFKNYTKNIFLAGTRMM